jgi:hypothetical protein
LAGAHDPAIFEHMFESAAAAHPATLAAMIEQLQAMPPVAEPAGGIEVIGLLESLKAVAAAAQARQTVVFVESRCAEQATAGVPAKQVGRGIAHEVGLAKRCAPALARKYVGWARALTTELPNTLRELQGGRTTEWRAILVARESGWLSREHRAQIDTDIAPRLGELGDRLVERETRAMAQRLDPAGAADRARNAESDRHVSLRPAPDTMTRLSALLPVAQGVAAYAALGAAADSARAAGDPRSRGQVMADTLVERVTGQAHAEQVPMTVNLVMNPDAFTGSGAGANEPAVVDRYGSVPAPMARALANRAGDDRPVWLRRLLTDKAGRLISMETRRRYFTEAQREFLRLRDGVCATPYCEAPIRHADHATPASDGGQTTLDNGQSLCEACNYAKQAAGWTTHRDRDGTITVTTPTGHAYRSRAPDLPGTNAKDVRGTRADVIYLKSRVEAEFKQLAS